MTEQSPPAPDGSAGLSLIGGLAAADERGSADPIVSVGADVDVKALVEEIKAEVDRKVAAGVYPAELMMEIQAGSDPLAAALLQMRDAADFSMVAPINSPTRASLRYVAPGVVFTKRVIRKGVAWHTRWLVGQLHRFAVTVVDATTAVADRLAENQAELIRTASRQDDTNRRVAGQQNEFKQRLDRMQRSLPSTTDSPAGRSAAVDIEFDYVEFENRYRGTREDIAGKQRQYLDCFGEAGGPIVDIGCGRGEFLEVLRDAGRQAYGVDMSPEMVSVCRARDLHVRQEDGLAHLQSLPDGALAGIFAAQVLEHFDPRQLVLFIREAARVLKPGGTLVAETLNPQSLATFTNALYVDLGHLRPLHPLTMGFLADVEGFAHVEIRYSSPLQPQDRLRQLPQPTDPALAEMVEALNANLRRVDDVLFGPQDFALVAHR